MIRYKKMNNIIYEEKVKVMMKIIEMAVKVWDFNWKSDKKEEERKKKRKEIRERVYPIAMKDGCKKEKVQNYYLYFEKEKLLLVSEFVKLCLVEEDNKFCYSFFLIYSIIFPFFFVKIYFKFII